MGSLSDRYAAGGTSAPPATYDESGQRVLDLADQAAARRRRRAVQRRGARRQDRTVALGRDRRVGEVAAIRRRSAGPAALGRGRPVRGDDELMGEVLELLAPVKGLRDRDRV